METLVQADMIGFSQLDVVQQDNKNIRVELTNVRKGLFRRYDEFTSEIKNENATLRASDEILKTEIETLRLELIALKDQVKTFNTLGDRLQNFPEQKKPCQVYFI